jgi:hypothetical protein
MISSSDYKYVSDRVSDNYTFNEKIRDALLAALGQLNLSDRPGLTQDGFVLEALKTEISNTLYTYVVTDRIEVSDLSLDLVSAMQLHVTTHYGSVNGFLSDSGVKVKQDFADLSERAGYTIDSGNIE